MKCLNCSENIEKNYCPGCGSSKHYSNGGFLEATVTTFKKSGKYYTQGKVNLQFAPPYKMWEQIQDWAERGKIPGLSDGTDPTQWVLSVDIPDHPWNHPHLIVNMKDKRSK